MSKYKLTNLLNEYIGGGRIGTLRTTAKHIIDRMDELEEDGEVVVRELQGPSGDGKVQMEFEVVDRESAIPGGKGQERGFTVYDYKFGFDPRDPDHVDVEYDYSIGGNDIRLAMDLFSGDSRFEIVKGRFMENGHVDDFADEIKEEKKMDADEVIDIIKMMNPDAKEDLLKQIADMGKKVDENMYIDDEEWEKEMGRSPKDSLKKEMMIHVSQLIDGNIDMNDFMNVVEDIMAEVNSLEESEGPSDKAETEDDVVNVDKVASPSAKGKGYSSAVDAERSESGKEQDDITQTTRPMYKESLKISDIAEDVYGMRRMQLDKVAKKLQDGPLKYVPTDIVIDFIKTHIKDIRGASDEEIRDEFENFRSVNYDYIDEDLKKHFKRFK